MDLISNMSLSTFFKWIFCIQKGEILSNYKGSARWKFVVLFSIFAMIKAILFVYLTLNERLIIISSSFEKEKNINKMMKPKNNEINI